MSLLHRFLKHFPSKTQLPGFSISGRLVSDGLKIYFKEFLEVSTFLLEKKLQESFTKNVLLKIIANSFEKVEVLKTLSLSPLMSSTRSNSPGKLLPGEFPLVGFQPMFFI